VTEGPVQEPLRLIQQPDLLSEFYGSLGAPE
jgi:hypothetical protein